MSGVIKKSFNFGWIKDVLVMVVMTISLDGCETVGASPSPDTSTTEVLPVSIAGADKVFEKHKQVHTKIDSLQAQAKKVILESRASQLGLELLKTGRV